MSPSTITHHDDDASFLSLLAKQREILNKLHKEERSSSNGRDDPVSERPTETAFRPSNHNTFDQVEDPLFLMNQPLAGKCLNHLHDEESLHRKKNRQRISARFENDYHFPSIHAAISLEEPIKDEAINSRKDEFCRGSRLPEDTLFLQENLGRTTQPSFSAIPSTNRVTQGTFAKSTARKYNRITFGFDRSKFKYECKNFALAMEKSAKSQQDIHKWDRMMGLKRSHSKTMRLSRKSRSELKKIFSNRRS